MEAKIDRQLKKFWLAYNDGWKHAVGHEVQVDNYRFSVCPTKKGIVISEVTTGMRIEVYGYNVITDTMCATKEGMIDYINIFVVPRLISIVEKKDLGTIIKECVAKAEKTLGKMPPIELVDESILDPVSEVLN